MKRLQHQPVSPDHAFIQIALLERPLGDEYINETIWKHTDELIADSDRRCALDENGLRVGQLVGAVPGGFQELLLSKRVCSNPQAMIFQAGRTVPILLGGVLPHSSYEVVQDKVRTEVILDQVRYCLCVKAKFTSDGSTTLTFTPNVENGAAVLPFEASSERFTWEMKVGRACKKYPELSWEVTLKPNQYVIAGTRLERERTLGRGAFTEIDDQRAVQRLLVIRNSRAVTAAEAHQSSVEELVRADQAPPLALQATSPATRAKSN